MKLIIPFAWLTLSGNNNPPVSTFTTRQRDPETLMEKNKGMEILVFVNLNFSGRKISARTRISYLGNSRKNSLTDSIFV